MALELGNLFGAATSLTTAFGKDKSLKSFLDSINGLGIQVQNNFEINIFGLEDITFFAQSVNIGGIVQSFEDVYYNGRSIPIPTFIDYDHNGSMTVINDGSGYIYAAISNFLMDSTTSRMVSNGVKMTIKCLTGDKKYKGSVITLRDVRLEKLDGLTFDYSANNISTFGVSFTYLDFTFTPGALATVGGVFSGINSLIS